MLSIRLGIRNNSGSSCAFASMVAKSIWSISTLGFLAVVPPFEGLMISMQPYSSFARVFSIQGS
jgi:hypothetical protein